MAARPRTRPAPPTATSRTRRGGGKSTSTGSRIAALAGLAAAVAVVAAFVVYAGTNAADPAAGPVELGHVHGLGVDPASGDLYAGSHYGLFRLPEGGAPVRMGDVQDFMGFTVTGPGRFLASGHPGAGQDGPSNLGLIESTDGGRSWQTLSLAGEADFHALEAKHGMVYGYNAGQLMVSRDTRTWETRAQLAMADLAVSPQDPETVLATTRDGLARSIDGGRRFAVVGTAPLLRLLTWLEAGSLIGVAPDGTVYASGDGGTTWERRGFAGGEPEALTTFGDQVFVAFEGGIVQSGDGGRIFRNRYLGP